eukprot:TRINITY_DN1196_c0_g1_i5.p1 TRINITY_DN1196_c0_g1~~TRINITY_DN1196_c0_g1_i5.p1  ORF type:complete len:502 (-),score=117.03 TRINITY_DN1196_c0_g1_i5:221-1726(-)
MLLQKQKEVAQWSTEHNIPISPQLIQLWNQAMTQGEEDGKKAYQQFLDAWQEYQKNPPRMQQPTEWQKKLLQKQQEVMQTAYRKGISVPRDLINLWEQAISGGEKEGQKAYDEFLKKWDELQRQKTDQQKTEPQKTEPLAGQYVNYSNPWTNPNVNNEQQSNQYQNQGQYHQHHGYGSQHQGSYNRNPHDQGYNQGYNQGYDQRYNPEYNQGYNQRYNQDYNQARSQGYGQGSNQGYGQGSSQQNNLYGQWHVDPNWKPGSDSNTNPSSRTDTNPLPRPTPPPSPYNPYNRVTDPQSNPQPNPYNPNQYDPNQYNPNPYNPSAYDPYQSYRQSPYQGQNQYGYNRREPFAGQQLNEYQNELQDVQKEIMQWAEQNGVSVPPQVILQWEEAMQSGTKEAHDSFIQMWKHLKDNPAEFQNMTTRWQAANSGSPWKTAIINQIEGQNIIAVMLGLNLVNELTDLRNQIMKLDQEDIKKIVNALMDTWNKINIEINKYSENEKRR